ncbi:unnamed protein product [Discosporangium mesarthrocarpum]
MPIFRGIWGNLGLVISPAFEFSSLHNTYLGALTRAISYATEILRKAMKNSTSVFDKALEDIIFPVVIITMAVAVAYDEGQDEEREPKRRRSYPRSDYRGSAWMKMLECDARLMDSSTREAENFRRQFRFPFPFYTKLVEECKWKRWFGRAGCIGAVGRQAIPVKQKLSIFSRSASE